MPRNGSNRHGHGERNGNDYGYQHGNRNGDRNRHNRQHGYRHDHQSAANDHTTIEPAAASLRRRADTDCSTAKTRAAIASRVFTSMAFSFRDAPLDRSTPCDQAHQHYHDGDHEEHVNQPASDVKHAEAENPQNEKNYRQCPQHVDAPARVSRTAHP